MTLQPSMLSAILSMDAYNRGYNAAINGLSNNTNGTIKLGSATIVDDLGDTAAQTIGFYAIAYDIDDNGDGIADRKIIAYRGTDFPEDGPLLPRDIRHGWPLGVGNLDSEQAAMAVAFYKEVVGAGNQYTANVSLTGHSLGGGLASFIGALYDQDVYSFDTMTFQAAVEKVERIMTTNAAYLDTHYTVRWEALNPRFSLWYESSQSGLTYEQAQQKIAELAALHYVRNVTMETMMPAIVDDIYDGITFKAPDFAGMYGFYVNGELLDVALTARGDEHQYIALTSMDGVDIISDRTIVPGWFIINEVYNTSKEALARHSMTALIIDKYSWSSSLISDSSIQQIKHYMWPLLFNSGFAEDIGMNTATLEGELRAAKDYAGILRMILAYSAVDEGENSTAARPFGDTAIKAMMADFNDLGSILEYIEHSPGLDIDNSAIKILASDISQYIINYAGQLALNKVLESDSPNAIVGVLNNHNGISTVNLSPAIWGQRIGEADNKVNIFKEDIVANALNIYDNAARILSVATSIWGQDAKTAIDYIDIDYALGSSHYNSRMYEFRHEVQTSHLLYLGVQADLDNLPYNNAVQYYHSANAANAILIGSNGHDRLKGNYGSDIFYGGAGDDWFDGGFDLYIPSVDIVVYDGNYSEYKITYKDTHVEVRALNSDEGTDYLYGIEQLSFNNRLYDLSFSYWSRYGSEFNELDDISNAWHSGAVNLPKRGYETYDGSKWVVYPYLPVNGTDGSDRMSSVWGNYYLNGGNGNDVISNELYGSSISGGAGNDKLFAYNDGILVDGGDGNDILVTSSYYNKLVGGLGDDVYQLGSWVNSVNNGLYEVGLIEEEEDGGHDTITTYYPIELWMASDGYLYIRYADFYDHEPQPYKINTFSGVPSVEVLINEDDRSITDLRMGLNMKTWGDFDSGHYVQGTAYNDVITTGFGNQYIHAGAGDDIIYANTQQQDYTSQIMYGENGNDLFYLDGGWSEHHWYVDGGAGDDVFHGIGGYMNTIQGGTGYDIGYIGGNYNSYDVINRGSYIEYFGTRLYSIEKLYFDNGYYSSGTFTPYASGNQNPIVKNDNFNVFKNTKLSGNLLADNGHGIDYDPDGDVITVGVAHYEATTMQGGKIYLSGDGSFMYEPPVNYTGTDQYWYSVKDEHGLSSGGSMHFNILPSSNSTPIAQNDLFYLDQDSVISGNVLVNDSDPDGDTLNVVAGTYATAQGGSVMIAANGGFTYTPLSGFYGFDNFNYTVQDGKGGSNAASVHLTINEGVNLISTIDFTDVVFNAYSTGQDMGGTISVRGDGSEVVLSGNTWKRMGFNYIVTENTVIEFEFRSTTQGELQGFVLDTDNNFSTGGKVIQLYGTENNSRFDRMTCPSCWYQFQS